MNSFAKLVTLVPQINGMKPYLIVLFILFNMVSIAQKIDSLEIRLTQFKTLLEKDLITKDEYHELKAKELGIKVIPVDLKANERNENSETAIKNSKQSVKRKVEGGIVCTVLGVSALIGGGVLLANELGGKPTAENRYLPSAIVLSMGGILSISGLFSFISASVERSRQDRTILQKD